MERQQQISQTATDHSSKCSTTRHGVAIASFLLAMLFMLAAPALAGPPYTVDDPGTPDYQHIEENTSYTSSRAGKSASYGPSTEINYGYSKSIELTVSSGICAQCETGRQVMTGMGDSGIEFKWRFQEEDAETPGLSVHYLLKVPTASAAKGLGTGKYDHMILLAAGRQLRRIYAFGDIGQSLPGGPSGRTNLIMGGAFSYQLTPTVTLGGQLYGNTSAGVGEKGDLSWGVIATRDMLPGRTLMLQIGHSTQGFSDLNVYAGVQFILDTRRRSL